MLPLLAIPASPQRHSIMLPGVLLAMHAMLDRCLYRHCRLG